jgi:hypothetical protein
MGNCARGINFAHQPSYDAHVETPPYLFCGQELDKALLKKLVSRGQLSVPTILKHQR